MRPESKGLLPQPKSRVLTLGHVAKRGGHLCILGDLEGSGARQFLIEGRGLGLFLNLALGSDAWSMEAL